MEFLHSQIFIRAMGIIGLILGVAAFQSNKHKNIVLIKMGSEAAFTIQYFLLDAYTGSIMNGVGVIRNFIFYFRDKNQRTDLASPILISLCIAAASILSWEGIHSLLITLGLVVNTVCMGICDAKSFRKTILISSTLILAYNFFALSYSGMLSESISLISVVIGFPLTMLRAYIVDNTRNRKGKYRPYIISTGIPTVILAIGYFWAPYEKMESQALKCAVVLLFNIGFQFFYNFLYDAYYNYVVVLSPNTQERANVSSIKAVTDSFGPTITGVLIPLLAKSVVGTNNLNDIRIYRIVWPPILIVCLALSFIVYAYTNEKIVQAKTHVVQIKFIDALREVAKNKYFWVISLAGWLGFLESACLNILNWLYSYQHACTAGQYALITTVYGNASLWGMLLAPLSIKKLGKGKTVVTVLSDTAERYFSTPLFQ